MSKELATNMRNILHSLIADMAKQVSYIESAAPTDNVGLQEDIEKAHEILDTHALALFGMTAQELRDVEEEPVFSSK